MRAERGCSPVFLRMDNGPEFIAQVTKDWCHEVGTNTAYIDPGSPWQNGHCESFNDKLRDELLNFEIFDSMWEVRTMLQDRRHSYNHYRPHSSLELPHASRIRREVASRKRIANLTSGGPMNGVRSGLGSGSYRHVVWLFFPNPMNVSWPTKNTARNLVHMQFRVKIFYSDIQSTKVNPSEDGPWMSFPAQLPQDATAADPIAAEAAAAAPDMISQIEDFLGSVAQCEEVDCAGLG